MPAPFQTRMIHCQRRPNGAGYLSLGRATQERCPRFPANSAPALKGRHTCSRPGCLAPSGLVPGGGPLPGALPQAEMPRPVGATQSGDFIGVAHWLRLFANHAWLASWQNVRPASHGGGEAGARWVRPGRGLADVDFCSRAPLADHFTVAHPDGAVFPLCGGIGEGCCVGVVRVGIHGEELRAGAAAHLDVEDLRNARGGAPAPADLHFHPVEEQGKLRLQLRCGRGGDGVLTRWSASPMASS